MAVLKSQSTEKHIKTEKDDNLLETKEIIKPKCKLRGDLVFSFSWPVESNQPSSL